MENKQLSESSDSDNDSDITKKSLNYEINLDNEEMKLIIDNEGKIAIPI